MPPLTGASSFRPDVQGLRALAVLLVVADHALGWPSGGYVGVDVFFVVSGFLITGLLLREHRRTGRVDLREFYARRVRRLLPAGVLALSVTNLAAWLLFTGERAAQTLTDAGWALAFAANLRFAAIGTDYFDATRPASPVQHYWSLAVEEQFYLVWPCLLLGLFAIARRRAPSSRLADRRLLLAVAVLSLASLGWSVLRTSSEAAAAYFSTPARAYELGLGALLALALHTGALARAGRRSGPALRWAGLVLIVLAAIAYDERTAFPGAAALLPVVGTVLVLYAGTNGTPGPLLGNRLSGYLGGLSYSLYLWHWPVIVLAAATLPAGAGRTALVLGLGFGLAVLCHHLVEEPVRRSGWLSRRPRTRPASASVRWRRPARSGVAVGAIGALLLSGWVLPALAIGTERGPAPSVPGAPSSAEELRRAVGDSVAPPAWPQLEVPLAGISRSGSPEWIVDRCDNVNAGNAERCVYGDPAAPRTAALVGDSIAISYLPGLRRALEPLGWKIAVLTRNQCPLPRVGLWRTRPSEPFVQCTLHKDWVLERLQELRPDLVLASNDLAFLDQQEGEPTGPARFTSWRRGLATSLSETAATTDRLVLLGPPPRSGNLQSCVTRLSSPVDCTRPVPADWKDLRTAERAAATEAGAGYIDVEQLFCASGRCPAVVGSTPVYTDGRHLTAAYSERLAPHLLAGLRRTGGATG